MGRWNRTTRYALSVLMVTGCTVADAPLDTDRAEVVLSCPANHDLAHHENHARCTYTARDVADVSTQPPVIDVHEVVVPPVEPAPDPDAPPVEGPPQFRDEGSSRTFACHAAFSCTWNIRTAHCPAPGGDPSGEPECIAPPRGRLLFDTGPVVVVPNTRVWFAVTDSVGTVTQPERTQSAEELAREICAERYAATLAQAPAGDRRTFEQQLAARACAAEAELQTTLSAREGLFCCEPREQGDGGSANSEDGGPDAGPTCEEGYHVQIVEESTRLCSYTLTSMAFDSSFFVGPGVYDGFLDARSLGDPPMPEVRAEFITADQLTPHEDALGKYQCAVDIACEVRGTPIACPPPARDPGGANARTCRGGWQFHSNRALLGAPFTATAEDLTDPETGAYAGTRSAGQVAHRICAQRFRALRDRHDAAGDRAQWERSVARDACLSVVDELGADSRGPLVCCVPEPAEPEDAGVGSGAGTGTTGSGAGTGTTGSGAGAGTTGSGAGAGTTGSGAGT